MIRTIILLIGLVGMFIYPTLLLFFAVVNFCAVAFKNIYPVFLARGFRLKNSVSEPNKGEPFISVFVATHNEPPLILKNTLLSLSRLDYENYEVLVMDNNTPDQALWKPVQKFCQTLGQKFKFYHVENLKGFKAGALNLLMKKINSKTEFVAVIDADYEVNPKFLSEAVKNFTNNKIVFVQLPQAYGNVSQKNRGLTVEYEYFFANYMAIAQNLECVNATGTLGVFRAEALKKLGGFNTSTITEDAELGTRIALAGYYGVYNPKIMGRGLMPHSLADLKKQRLRWAIGNAQVLKKYFFQLISSPNLNWKQKFSLFFQLTAWANFTFPASLIIVILGGLKLFSVSKPIWDTIFIVSLATLLMFLALKAASFFRTFYKKYSPSDILRAFLVHIGMNYVYSINYFSGLLGLKFNFVRTNKFLKKNLSDFFEDVAKEFYFAFFVFVLSIGLLLLEEYTYFFGLLVVAVIPMTVFFTLMEVSATRFESEQWYLKIRNNIETP